MRPRYVDGEAVNEGDHVRLCGTVMLANGRMIDVRPDKQPQGFEIIAHVDARALEKVTDKEGRQ